MPAADSAFDSAFAVVVCAVAPVASVVKVALTYSSSPGLASAVVAFAFHSSAYLAWVVPAMPATSADSAFDSASALAATATALLALVEFAKFGFDSVDAHADPTLVEPVEHSVIP
jgi:hypothetical protein